MIETKNIADKRPSRVLAIILMFALFFMIAFVTAYQTPLGRVIKNLSNGDTLMSQLGMFANFIGYAVMGYPAGVILQRHGYRITALVAVTVGFFGVLDNVLVW
jgi:FHS family L-fucose permease-like MFS transporter